MIKFWKSAAKGKSGCPVRPPEHRPLHSDIKNSLSIELGSEIECQSDIFEKKSKLSFTLHDILVDKKAIKYFMLFMETIGKHLLVRCWLEFDNFKFQVSDKNKINEDDKRIQISRTKSFDVQCTSNTQQRDEDSISHKFSWRSSTSNLKLNRSECSTSSCGNLTENTAFRENFNPYEKTFVNLTEEAINLFKKYVALEAPNKLQLPDDLRKSVITNICQPEGEIREDCFEPVQHALFKQMETYFNEFQNSPLYVKAQIDVLTTGSIDLADILYNDTILFYFTEYLEQESCSILLEFLMAVMHYRNNIINNNDLNTEQVQGDAIILYDKYFSLQATNPVGFPTEIRLKVESDICAEEGPLPTSFDVPFKIIYQTLSNYVKTFLESELYYSYLSEMVHSVDRLWSSKFKSHSDCSSEFSISTQNTLLAMGDPLYKKKRNHSVPDMSIDSNQLYNADALWQRKKHDGLSLGRINSLGRFESKFEPDPDKKDRSVLKKMVSKLVPTNTSKVEEEMAWQIAHMIVKDVTDLTMAPPDNDNGDI
ncbi:A-kinase anchor protein 10, mitochondrial [Epargyreus clarus]|uniref:A-kinase anchor protein 10, mitochondrial n=1 Tax=Epargyreus clarus TaxID=520877 RepID=UPI003C2E7F42